MSTAPSTSAPATPITTEPVGWAAFYADGDPVTLDPIVASSWAKRGARITDLYEVVNPDGPVAWAAFNPHGNAVINDHATIDHKTALDWEKQGIKLTPLYEAVAPADD